VVQLSAGTFLANNYVVINEEITPARSAGAGKTIVYKATERR
jgi:hypothetical protein